MSRITSVRVARTRRQWRPFAQARALARSLGLKSITEWQHWAASPERPKDIPSDPYVVYRAEWINWPDWLGKQPARQWRPFVEAKTFVHSLGLGTFEGWREWAKTSARPPDIPSSPRRAYRDQWAGWADWLGR
jgi:hypothetical protein